MVRVDVEDKLGTLECFKIGDNLDENSNDELFDTLEIFF